MFENVSVTVADDKKFVVGDPELCSKALDFARPISNTWARAVPKTVPLVPCSSSTSLTDLNASVSPETNPISGVPKTSLTFMKEPILNLVTEPLAVSNSLALSTSTKVVPIFAISYPLTYALP